MYTRTIIASFTTQAEAIKAFDLACRLLPPVELLIHSAKVDRGVWLWQLVRDQKETQKPNVEE